MFKLDWDPIGEHLFETGVDRGVVYPKVGSIYPKGAAWNGLIGVTLTPSGADATPLYANNHKYLNLIALEDLGMTIEAYTYPDEFGECNGEVEMAPGVVVTQQERKEFGFSFRSLVGNDVEGTDFGYKLHLIYGALATPTEEAYETVNDSPDANTMSWECTTTPIELDDFEPTAHIEIDSTVVNPYFLEVLEQILYGVGGTEARLPLPDEIVKMLTDAVPVAAIYNGVELPLLPEAPEGYPYISIRLKYSDPKCYAISFFSSLPTTVMRTEFPYNGVDIHGVDGEVHYEATFYLGMRADWLDTGFVEYTNVNGTDYALDRLVWTNYDVYTSSGELYMPASASPVPVYQGPMHSFNGIPMAALPEWDKTLYPYAYIFKGMYDNYTLRICSNMPTTGSGTIDTATHGYGGNMIDCSTNPTATHWWDFSSTVSTSANAYLSDIVWANYDVLDPDGNLYLKGSESKPVTNVLIVAGLYNGVELPPLPEIRTDYPYIRITKNSSGMYEIACFSSLPTTTVSTAILMKGDVNGVADEETFYEGGFYWGAYADWGSSNGLYEKTSNSVCKLEDIFWVNYDVYTSDGELYLPASSSPIPVYQGPLYSYNRIPMAELPEWDKETFPYAYIRKEDDGTYMLFINTEQPVTWQSSNSDTPAHGGNGGEGVQEGDQAYCSSNLEATHWWGFTDSSSSCISSHLDNIVWANYDILNLDGSVYLNASEPVLIDE